MKKAEIRIINRTELIKAARAQIEYDGVSYLFPDLEIKNADGGWEWTAGSEAGIELPCHRIWSYEFKDAIRDGSMFEDGAIDAADQQIDVIEKELNDREVEFFFDTDVGLIAERIYDHYHLSNPTHYRYICFSVERASTLDMRILHRFTADPEEASGGSCAGLSYFIGSGYGGHDRDGEIEEIRNRLQNYANHEIEFSIERRA